MIRLLLSARRECINIHSALLSTSSVLPKAGDNRMLFMPHSPGIYVALVLKSTSEIEQEQMMDYPDSVSDLSAFTAAHMPNKYNNGNNDATT